MVFTKGSLTYLRCMEGYINILEGSRPMLGCLIGYMKGSMTMLECPVGHIDVM
jgi:hypothetical protein